MYGCTVWSSCTSENLERVEELQKRAARVTLDVDTRDRRANLFKDLPFAYHCDVNIRPGSHCDRLEDVYIRHW